METSFLDRLVQFGDSEAIVFQGTSYGYNQLLAAVAEWQAYLDGLRVLPGDIVTLEGAYSPATCAGLLALIERGAVVVPLSPLPAAKRADFLEIAQVEVEITIDADGCRRGERTIRRADHELYCELRRTGHAGLVLFSSGTTGRSKASLLDFDKVLAKYGPAGRARRILTFLSLDHIGGINTLLHTLTSGGTVITVPDRLPEAVFATIEAQRVQILPTTPTFLNMALISAAHRRWSTESLELITYGTEPMPLGTLQRLKSELPNVRLKQTYGLSELGILPTRSRSDDTLWVKLGDSGFAHKIIDDVLWIKSDMAMLGYLNAPAPFDEDGYFNTQDVVRVDGEWVHILGRRSEIINVGGEKVYPSEVEGVLLELPNIADVVVSGRPSHVTGMVVMAVVQLVEQEDLRQLRRRVREYCLDRLEPFKIPALIEVSTVAQHSDRYKKIRSTT
jgi:acyl-CoA synthetase (AMP-forming)/AMP-acid ligase II